MTTRSSWMSLAAVGLLCAVGVPTVCPTAADAAVVICERKGKLKLRLDACTGKETLVDPAELGATGPMGPIGPQGNAGQPGTPGPGARWALIDSDGTILAQSGGISVTLVTTVWMVDFGTSLAGKTIMASNAFTTADTPNRGPTTAALCGPTGSIPGICGTGFGAGFENDHTVAVVTSSTGGSNEAHAFFIAAF